MLLENNMKSKTKLLIALGIAVIIGTALVISLNIGKPKEWSNTELDTFFHDNEKTFSVVAQGLENQESGFRIELRGKDLDNDGELVGFSDEFMSALKTLQKLQMVQTIYVTKPNAVYGKGVTFELGYIAKGYRGSYVFTRSSIGTSSIMRKINDDWYLAIAPNT